MMKRLLACLLVVACLLMGFALAEGETLDMRVIKCTTRVNIREYPTTNATVVSHAPLGAVLVGCQKCPRAPEWYAVVYEGIAGYIRGDFLEVVGETAVPAVAEAPAEPAPAEEAPAEAAPVEEAPVEEAPIVEEPAPDAASADVEEYDPANDPVPEGEPELAVDDVPEDEPIVVDEPVAAAVEEAPVEEAPVEEAPVEEAPVEEAPVEEAPVEAAPVAEAIELPAVENAPIAGITDDSGYESDSVILDETAGNAHIIARRIFQENREYLAVAALDENGSPIWMQETAVDEIGEVNMTDAFIGGIAARPLVMLYNAQQGLAAIDAANGSVRWLLSKDAQNLGAGLCHAVVPGNGIMYIGGFHGPDPVAIDANGNVLWQSDSGSDATWLYSIELTSDGIRCAYDNMDGAGNPGAVIYDYSGAVKEVAVG